MTFLCVSDQVDPLVYSNSVQERYKDIDAVLCAGDLSMEYVDFIVDALGKPTFFIFGNHDLEDFPLYHKGQRAHNQAEAMGLMMNEVQASMRGHGADYVSNKVIAHKKLFFTKADGNKSPLLIAGVSGSIRYNNGLDQYTNRQMFFQLLKMVPALLLNKILYGRYLDIFLTHASPRHIHDKEDPCHKGFECFNWFIKKFKPALLVHGHIHLYDLQATRVTKSHETTVVNAYSHIVIEYTPDFSNPKGDSSGSINIRTDR